MAGAFIISLLLLIIGITLLILGLTQHKMQFRQYGIIATAIGLVLLFSSLLTVNPKARRNAIPTPTPVPTATPPFKKNL